MAGSNSAFSAAEFRAAIHQAMEMGAAVNVAEQPLFVFPLEPAAGSPASGGLVDAEYVPFNPNLAPPLEPTKASVRAPCVIEYTDSQGDLEPLGMITQSRLVLTFLDVDYATIEGFDHVMIDGDRYNYARTEPPSALFDAGLYRIHVLAEDES